MITYLTVAEVAAHIKMSPRFVGDEIRRKRLRASKLGGEWRVTERDLQTYTDANANVRPVKKAAS